jgi:hypothetical protein
VAKTTLSNKKYRRLWYSLTPKEIKDKGGSTSLSKYGNSSEKLIESIYMKEYLWGPLVNRFLLQLG